jgi:hypothetical protein
MLVLLTLLACCTQAGPASVVREELFTLEIGRFEDQIALYNLEGDRGIQQAGIVMRDGLFYLSDGTGEKILRYNSYGDLLFMIYNDETNPIPLTLKEKPANEVITRWAWTYPLVRPGHLAVDERKHIFVEDQLPPDRHRVDPETAAILDRVILHFDEDGQFVEYLGQEGLGGSPFPRIDGLYSSLNSEIAVICHLPTGWNIYWFSADGLLQYLITLHSDAIPVPGDRDTVFSAVNSFAVAPDAHAIYLLVDYYRNTFDESTGIKTGSEPDSACIWVMDVKTGLYTKTMEIPFYESTALRNNRRVSEKMLYSLMGATRNNRLFLSFPEEQGYELLVISLDSQEQRRGFIQVTNDELQFHHFNLSDDGILSALLLSDFEAKVVWWRTDMLFAGGGSS